VCVVCVVCVYVVCVYVVCVWCVCVWCVCVCGQIKPSIIKIIMYRYESLKDGVTFPRNGSFGDFVVVRTCTYTNLDSTV